MAFTIARVLLPMHHSRFWEVFFISSHCDVSNMRGAVQEPAQEASTFVTFVQQIDNSSFNRLLKWHFFGINLVYPGGSFWDQPHQGPPGAMEREVAQAHELLDLAKAQKWHEARR